MIILIKKKNLTNIIEWLMVCTERHNNVLKSNRHFGVLKNFFFIKISCIQSKTKYQIFKVFLKCSKMPITFFAF